MPGQKETRCEITHTFGREEAFEIIRRSQQDYLDKFGHISTRLSIAALDALETGQQIKQRTKKIKDSNNSKPKE
jgi:inorganic pyrophosphatase